MVSANVVVVRDRISSSHPLRMTFMTRAVANGTQEIGKGFVNLLGSRFSSKDRTVRIRRLRRGLFGGSGIFDAAPSSLRIRRGFIHAAPASALGASGTRASARLIDRRSPLRSRTASGHRRSEEHTSELQSLTYLVC